jgi:hypothetical protein
MVLKINGEKVDFTLENEKNAYEMVSSIFSTLSKDDILVVKVIIDGKEYLINDMALKNIPLENIGEMNVLAQKKDEIVYDLLFECQRLFFEIKRELKENKLSRKKEILDVLNWVKETVETVSGLGYFHNTEANTICVSIDRIIQYISDVEKSSLQVESLINILDSLEDYIRTVRERVVFGELPSQEDLKERIEKTIDLLPQISEAFQTGDDKKAFNNINCVLSTLETFCIYLKKHINSYSDDRKSKLAVLYEDLNSILMRIIEAFENQDLILISDLFEYELSDKLKEYLDIVFK